MSLSKLIIHGSDQEVKEKLESYPQINVIDEYGYTPLIQAAIVDSVSKAELLLNAGAKPDFQDLTGRTALFWAADNNNYELCKLCLSHGADPNSYSSGAQPVLVMPFMKGQQEIKKLLVSSGANLEFAQDFLNAKVLGHSFELEGRIDIVDTKNTFIEVELEGFYLRFTLEIIASSLTGFRNNFGAKKLRDYFPKLDIIIRSLYGAIALIQLQNYLIDVNSFVKKINALLDTSPLILPISFGGHAITFIKNNDYFVRCDRGEYGMHNGTVIYYKINNPAKLTKDFCREVLYKRQDPDFINDRLPDYLGLHKQKILNLPVQKTGNCSWANAEAIVPAIMFLLLEQENPGNSGKNEAQALYFYDEWREWDKRRSLDFCIQSLSTASQARKCTKAALLCAILFQACDYENPNDREKANKILNVLIKPEYKPILKCYALTFAKSKNHIMWQNFTKYLEDFGVDTNILIT